MTAASDQALRIGRASILLLTLSILIIVTPIMRHAGWNSVVLTIAGSLVLLAAVYSATGRRTHLIIALALALPPLIMQFEGALLGTSNFVHLRFAFNAMLFFYISTLILQALTKQTRVSSETVIGGINVYLLFIVGFAFLHALTEHLVPGSYLMRDMPLTNALAKEMHGDSITILLYFSTVTMTTLGYGEITPNWPTSRMLCSIQAIIGQLYVAIIIARLVALQIAHNYVRDD